MLEERAGGATLEQWRGGAMRHCWMRFSRARPEAHPESLPGPGLGPARLPPMECMRGVAGTRGGRASVQVAGRTRGGRATGMRGGRALEARNSLRHLKAAGGLRVIGGMPVGCGARVVWAGLNAPSLTQRTARGVMGGAPARRGLRSSAGSSTSAGRSVRCAPTPNPQL